MTDVVDSTKAFTAKGARERSPSFPFISLKTSIERLEAFEDHYKRSPASSDTLGSVWGMKIGSGNVAQTVAALKSFGLLDAKRGASGVEITISEDGRTYLRAQQESTRRDIINRLALLPKQIHSHWENWGADRPKDAACLDQLVLKEAFTPDGAAAFLRIYDATISYAGLLGGSKIGIKPDGVAGEIHSQEDAQPPVQSTGDEHRDESSKANIGDYVLWCSGGVDQFAMPRQINWVSDDGSHVRVHGSLTGIPVNEISVAEPPKPPRVGVNPPRTSDQHASVDGELNVLLTGQRLQITADVDLAGVGRLKEALGHYETILKLLAPVQPN